MIYDSIWFLSELHTTSQRVITFSLSFYLYNSGISGFCTKWHLKDDPKTQDQQKETQQIRVYFESKNKTTIEQFPSKKNTHIIMSLPFHKYKKQKKTNVMSHHESSCWSPITSVVKLLPELLPGGLRRMSVN